MKKILLIFALAFLVTSCGGNANESKKKFTITTAVVKAMDDSSVKKFTFITQPYHTTNLSFRVSGPIKNFEAYSGNHFKRGSVIASIDDRDFIIDKERAAGVYTQAKAEYERIRNLYEKNNISASTLDKAKADYILAKTNYETACNNLSDTRLLAPFDGYIGEVFVERHQDVRASQPIVTLVDISKMRVETYINQEIAMKAGDLKYIDLRFDAMPNKLYRAKVEDISKSTTINNLSYLLTALPDNKDGKLLSGMSGEVVFSSASASKIIAVPLTAVSHRDVDGDYVWCVNSAAGTVSKRIVTLGSHLPDGYVEIKSNLKEGEIVAISGLRFLSDGEKVEIQ